MGFLHDFAPKRNALNHAVKFVPHYHIFSMRKSGDYNELCTDLEGRFCAEDPDGPGPITGKDVVHEDVRQLCIHQLTKVKSSDQSSNTHGVEYARPYWDYVARYLETCPISAQDPSYRFGTVCSE